MTDEILLESRRDLRERAFQALMALEYDGDIVEACRFAYLHDKDVAEDATVDLPAFLLNIVTGVYQSKDQLDQQAWLDSRTLDLGREKYSAPWNF